MDINLQSKDTIKGVPVENSQVRFSLFTLRLKIGILWVDLLFEKRIGKAYSNALQWRLK